MAVQNWESATREQLAQVLKASEAHEHIWSPDELAAMFRDQIQAPIEFDLGGLPSETALRSRLAATGRGLLLRSFADLFNHPHPPLELLDLTRRFAKAHQSQRDAGLPAEIPLMLYYTSIAAALVRCGERISSLNNADLAEGLDWAADQRWIDEDTRQLLRKARGMLGRNGET
ncbi:MAG TPA: hypothetical protein PKY77_16605 [Phycisphaerae bacterium]|nr:hypothetical protein [Phycisphaerae bacterium]HRY70760.1 hypothetical protein [Phycisphaerae bacterium]HSA28876.1 hypothetical protein [Phycisphaerae bacterium]